MNEATQQGATIGLLLFNIAAYFIGNFLGKCVNFLAKREAVNRRLFGVLGVLAVSSFFLIASLNILHSHQAALDRLPPFERGQIEGRLIAASIIPGIFVVIGVGIGFWLRRRKSLEQGGS